MDGQCPQWIRLRCIPWTIRTSDHVSTQVQTPPVSNCLSGGNALQALSALRTSKRFPSSRKTVLFCHTTCTQRKKVYSLSTARWGFVASVVLPHSQCGLLTDTHWNSELKYILQCQSWSFWAHIEWAHGSKIGLPILNGQQFFFTRSKVWQQACHVLLVLSEVTQDSSDSKVCMAGFRQKIRNRCKPLRAQLENKAPESTSYARVLNVVLSTKNLRLR